MIETHPFPPFVPKGARYLILGSFPGKPSDGNDWYYGAKRNQFWPILREIYVLKLLSRREKQNLFARLKIGVTDIIYRCERKRGSNLDNNLVNIVYNQKAIEKILSKNGIQKIFFTSRFVEKGYKKFFKSLIERYPKVEMIALPSPSPRYAKMSLKKKAASYGRLLPKLN